MRESWKDPVYSVRAFLIGIGVLLLAAVAIRGHQTFSDFLTGAALGITVAAVACSFSLRRGEWTTAEPESDAQTLGLNR